jgi:hypothetical protein
VAFIEDAFAAVDLEPVPELVTWFGWHNGTIGNKGLGHETESLDSGVFLQSLDDCLDLYGQAIEMTTNVASQGMDPSEYYPAPAFPITRHLGPYLDVVSCDPARSGLTWFVPWDGAAESNGPHLADLMERVAFRWKMGVTRWLGDRWAPRDEAWLRIGPDIPWWDGPVVLLGEWSDPKQEIVARAVFAAGCPTNWIGP